MFRFKLTSPPIPFMPIHDVACKLTIITNAYCIEDDEPYWKPL